MTRYGTMGWIFVTSGKGKEKSNIALTFSCLRALNYCETVALILIELTLDR